MHSAPNSDSCGDKVPSLNPFAPTFFFYFILCGGIFCPLVSQLRCGARVIREYYLALALPLFRRARTLLLSLCQIFLGDNTSLFCCKI